MQKEKINKRIVGQFGIVMTDEWVNRNNLQKVIYIDENGPIHDALSELFKIGYHDLKTKMEQRGNNDSDMAFTNKQMAIRVYGAKLWYNLLQLYEFIEPICNSYQHEWRLVQKDPLYGYEKTKKEIIENVSPPEGWAKIINVVKFQPKDVLGFVCPKNQKEKLYEVFPIEYASHKISTFLS